MRHREPRRVLIVSPHFPPINAPDMQRVRMSLPHYREFGWDPHVLAVRPSVGESIEPLLAATVPPDIPVERVDSISPAVARRAGIGNIALRALPYLHSAGSQVIARRGIDLTFFSTTMFGAMPLGRVWKQKHGTPYVLDIQDPWVTDYYETHPEVAPPQKYGLMKRVHARLEPWTMARVDGVMTVSDSYLVALRERYPRLRDIPCATVPFGASSHDFDLLETHPQPNVHFTASDGMRHGVFTGAAGDYMAPALRILFSALRHGLAETPSVFSRVQLHFVGTDYATGSRARRSVEPIARHMGVGDAVREQTERVPYFQALQLLEDAHFVIIVGSDDPAYMPSKLYPCLLAGRPIVAVVHARSAIGDILRQSPSNLVVTFDPKAADDEWRAARTLAASWPGFLDRAARDRPAILPPDLIPTARDMTGRQCQLFDRVMAGSAKLACA